jgi:hypothetical protein
MVTEPVVQQRTSILFGSLTLGTCSASHCLALDTHLTILVGVHKLHNIALCSFKESNTQNQKSKVVV